jgi:hypothetical protein
MGSFLQAPKIGKDLLRWFIDSSNATGVIMIA